MTGNLILDNAKELRLSEADSNGAHYIALKAAASLAADVTLTLPNNAPTAGQIIKANASTPTTLEWGALAASDLTGSTLASGITGSSLTGLGTLASLTVSGAISMTGTGAIDIASGTTAQRPGSASAGMLRFNSTSSEFEGYNGSAWGEIGGSVILIDGGNFDNGSSTVSTENVFDGGDFGS